MLWFALMEPENLTVRLIQEIRDEVRKSSEKSEVLFDKMDQHTEIIGRLLRDILNTASFRAR